MCQSTSDVIDGGGNCTTVGRLLATRHRTLPGRRKSERPSGNIKTQRSPPQNPRHGESSLKYYLTQDTQYGESSLKYYLTQDTQYGESRLKFI